MTLNTKINNPKYLALFISPRFIWSAPISPIKRKKTKLKKSTASTNLSLARKSDKPKIVAMLTILVLFISYKFVKGFLVITFLLLISSRNFHDVCQRFLYDQKRNFSWIWQNSPQTLTMCSILFGLFVVSYTCFLLRCQWFVYCRLAVTK